jgi:phosphate transport system substrate-binding protein
MSILNKSWLKAGKSIISRIWVGLVLVSCAEPPTPKTIAIDGSSTVYPITQAAVEQFQGNQQSSVDISVEFSGTSGGFKKFCEGETDISGASRPIKGTEMTQCSDNGISYVELPIAFDALTVVVNPNNNWVSSLTTEELKKMWEPAAEGKITRWSQVRPGLPDKPINLFGADVQSGTFDYFTEALMGQAGESRKDYVPNEDDELTVQAVSQDPNAIGYFGLSYYEAHKDELKAIAIDNGKSETPILPSKETVTNATYKPFARPLFIYVNLQKAQENPVLQELVEFYIEQAPEIVASVNYIPLTQESYKINLVTFHKGEVGTVFEGQSQFDLTLAELQRKQAKVYLEAESE